jgi:hypothetical protein
MSLVSRAKFPLQPATPGSAGGVWVRLPTTGKRSSQAGFAMRHLPPLFLLLGLSLAGCSSDPVERELVGTWQTAISSPVGAWQLRFTTLSNGQYRTDFVGPFAVAPEAGYFTASDGEWRIEKLTGSIEEGTYEFLSDDSVLFQSTAGAVVWNRIANTASPLMPGFAGTAPASAAIAPSPALGGAFAPPAPSDAPVAAPAVASSADLLATGPFGAALVQPTSPASANGSGFGGAPSTPDAAAPAGFAAGAAPAGFAGGVPAGFPAQNGMPAPPGAFGAANSAPNPVFGGTANPITPAGGAFGSAIVAEPALSIDGAVGGIQQQLESNARSLTALPQQALDDVQGSAEQAAAEVIGQAAAPITQATDEASRKVGQKIQQFSGNAASKVRNFFTGGKRNRDDEDASPEENAEENKPR